MDYHMVNQILAAKDLTNEPAFDSVKIGIEPIQRYDGCPLGLYFSVEEWSPYLRSIVPAGTIIVPPDAAEATLLHELGHRHGDYYYNDLSERYAEDFRKIYQPKGRVLLYRGSDFSKLSELGKLFDEGESGAIEMAFDRPLTPNELYTLKGELYSQSEKPRVHYGNSEVPWVRVEFTQGINWPVIVGSVMAGAVVLTAASLGYALYKTAENLPWVVPVSLFAFGIYIVLKSAVGEAKKYTVRR